MFSYPEEHRMGKMTASAIKGRETERHAEKRKVREEREITST